MDDRLVYCGVALLSACSWALGAILWRKLGGRLSSYAMNLAKTVGGSICLGVILLFVGFEPVNARSVLLLGLSGVIGIAIGDTFFFHSLMKLGPRRASLMGSLNPVAIAIGAAVVLGERPSATAWTGILATTCGVGWVLWERAPSVGSTEDVGGGIRCGLLSVLCTTVAVLLAKTGVASVAAIEAAWIRLLAGSAGLILWGGCRSELKTALEPLRKKELAAKVAGVITVVVIGGFWLSLVALKHIDAAIAGPLNSTSPLFILPLAVIFMKERLSLRTIMGTVIAVGGVALILKG